MLTNRASVYPTFRYARSWSAAGWAPHQAIGACQGRPHGRGLQVFPEDARAALTRASPGSVALHGARQLTYEQDQLVGGPRSGRVYGVQDLEVECFLAADGLEEVHEGVGVPAVEVDAVVHSHELAHPLLLGLRVDRPLQLAQDARVLHVGDPVDVVVPA